MVATCLGPTFSHPPVPPVLTNRSRRLRRAAALAGATTVVGVFSAAGVLAAHDFWLVPDAFAVAPGGWVEVRGQTSSSFPTSESAVALDRIADARLLSATGAEPLTGLSHVGTSLRIRHRPNAAGQYVVTTALRPRSLREASAGFRRYMELEGAAELAERYAREGLLPKTDSITRRYAKYAKTVVEVGQGGARAFERVAGHPLEFIPLTDPATLRVGDSLAVRLLYRSRPLARAHLHAGAAPAAPAGSGTEQGSPAARGGTAATKDLSLVTDTAGVARIPVARAGVWNVRTIHILPADANSGADWDVHWATFVFPVAGGRLGDRGASGGTAETTRLAAPQSADAQATVPVAAAPTTGTQGDSAAVITTVLRYHAAIGAGDSLAALALLTPDAVVLESGSFETRAEYRSHHLPSDIAFARAVASKRTPARVVVRGDVAWTALTSTAQGEFRGRAVNSSGAELMVLVRTTDGWRINAIHWSSRTRR